VVQHYRSGLNSIPTTEAFLDSPNNKISADTMDSANGDDRYLLRLAVGSITGVLTNIDSDGAASMGFHGGHANLFFDPGKPLRRSICTARDDSGAHSCVLLA
jgi:hypothetical protein